MRPQGRSQMGYRLFLPLLLHGLKRLIPGPEMLVFHGWQIAGNFYRRDGHGASFELHFHQNFTVLLVLQEETVREVRTLFIRIDDAGFNTHAPEHSDRPHELHELRCIDKMNVAAHQLADEFCLDQKVQLS